jgi:hypothetical protein
MNRSTVLVLVVGLLAGVGLVIAATSDVPTSGTVYVSANDAPSVGIAGGKTINMSSFGPAGETRANISTEGVLYADGDPNATVVVPSSETLDDSQIRIEQIDTNGTVGLETPQTQRIVVGGDIDNVTFRPASHVALDDGTVDFAYGGASGTSIVNVAGVPADTPIRAVDANSDTVLGVAMSDSNGRVNFSSLPNSNHQVTLQSASAPTLSNPSPTGQQQTSPSDLSVDVADADFSGDTVDVQFDVDGTTVTTATATSNSTVTASIPQRGLVGGTHSVTVIATDDAGQTDSLAYSYTVPSNLTIYNETNPSQIVKNAQVTVQFFAGQQVVTRTTTNGNISMDGLPVTQDMTITAEATGYETRTSYLETIYQQQRVYITNTSVATNDIVFSLDDNTGNFPSQETSLQIRKPISRDRDGDGNDESRFEVVAGDTFGASNEVAAALIGNGQRYRLVVENVDGDRRQLGAYTVTGNDQVTLAIGELSFSGDDITDTGVFTDAALPTIQGQRVVEFTYNDPEQATRALTYRIERLNNNSVLVSNTTISGPLGQFKVTEPVPASAPDDVAYQIVWNATRSGVSDAAGTERIGDIPEIAQQTGVDATVLSYLAYVAIAAVTGLVVVFDDRLAALTGTATATGLTMLGFVSIPPLALGMAGVISILVNLGRVA